MGYAKLNIWVKDRKCRLLSNAWRMDLVIQSCSGEYLADMDEDLISNLTARYPDFRQIVKLPNYMGSTRVKLVPAAGKKIYHVEVDVPPGCWIVWARMCHGRNEETNKVLVVAKCDDHICVNLLLNTSTVCAFEGIYPIAIDALQRQVGDQPIKDYLQVVKQVAVVQKADLQAWINDRIVELNDTQADPPTGLLTVNQQLQTLINELPDDCPC